MYLALLGNIRELLDHYRQTRPKAPVLYLQVIVHLLFYHLLLRWKDERKRHAVKKREEEESVRGMEDHGLGRFRGGTKQVLKSRR